MSAEEINTEKLIQLGKAVIDTESDAVSALLSRIDENFVKACEFILQCDGRTRALAGEVRYSR